MCIRDSTVPKEEIRQSTETAKSVADSVTGSVTGSAKTPISIVKEGPASEGLSAEAIKQIRKIHKPGLFRLLDVISRSH